jgi:hypothetical protein
MTELSQIRTPKFLPRKTRLVMGVDPGQVRDPCANCVIEHCTGVIDHGSDYERHTNQTAALGLQKKAERWRVVHVERLKLGTRYGDITRHVASMLADPKLQRDPSKNRSACELVLDFGGIGRGVAEDLIDAGIDPICVNLTGGLETNWKRRHLYSVPKEEAVILLDARIHHDRFPLTFSKHLTEADALKQEIADFVRSATGAGRMRYEARQGKHDDMVMALAIAVWWLSRPVNQPPMMFTYDGRRVITDSRGNRRILERGESPPD